MCARNSKVTEINADELRSRLPRTGYQA